MSRPQERAQVRRLRQEAKDSGVRQFKALGLPTPQWNNKAAKAARARSVAFPEQMRQHGIREGRAESEVELVALRLLVKTMTRLLVDSKELWALNVDDLSEYDAAWEQARDVLLMRLGE